MNWHYKEPLREVCPKPNGNTLYLLWIAAHHYPCLIWTHCLLFSNIAISCIFLSGCLQCNNTVLDPLPGRILPSFLHVQLGPEHWAASTPRQLVFALYLWPPQLLFMSVFLFTSILFYLFTHLHCGASSNGRHFYFWTLATPIPRLFSFFFCAPVLF